MVPFSPMDWLWQNLLSSGVWEVGRYLVLAAVSALVVWLRTRGSRWVSPLLYGLATFVMLVILLLGLQISRYISVQSESMVDRRNIEPVVKGWLASSGFGYVENSGLSSPQFALDTLLLNGSHMTVERLKPNQQYLVIRASVVVDGNASERIKRFPKIQVARLNRMISIELARANQLFNQVDLPNQPVSFEKHLAITSTLTQQNLVRAMGEVNSAQIVVAYTIANEVGL